MYSSEWGFAKLLHWLRHNPEKRESLVAALEHCDMVAAVLCGITDPDEVPRSICAMGHKWLWDGDCRPRNFSRRSIRCSRMRVTRCAAAISTSDQIAGRSATLGRRNSACREGIPIPVGAFDAHWDAIGAGIAEGDVVNVVGTATCIMAIAKETGRIPGLCGVVNGFDPSGLRRNRGRALGHWISIRGARRARWKERRGVVAGNGEVSRRPDRAAPHLVGQRRSHGARESRISAASRSAGTSHTAQDHLFAAIEGTAFHTRVILERMAEHGCRSARDPRRRHPAEERSAESGLRERARRAGARAGAIDHEPGSAIFAFLAAGTFKTIEEAQRALCPPYRVVEPDRSVKARYDRLFAHWRSLYFSLGAPGLRPGSGGILPELRTIAAGEVRASVGRDG